MFSRKTFFILAFLCLPAFGSGPHCVRITLWEHEEPQSWPIIDDWLGRFEALNPGVEVKRVHVPIQAMKADWKAQDIGDLILGANDFTDPTGNPRERIPFSLGNHLMLFFDQSKVPHPPKDTTEWDALVQQLSHPTHKQYGIVFTTEEPFWYLPFLHGEGIFPFRAGFEHERKDRSWNHAIEPLKKWITTQAAPFPCDHFCSKEAFLQRRAAMTIQGDWVVGGFYEALGTDLGISALPRNARTGLPLSPTVSGRSLFVSISGGRSKTQALKKLVRFLTSESIQLEVALRLGRLPALDVVWKNPRLQAHPFLSRVREAAQGGEPLPSGDATARVWEQLRAVSVSTSALKGAIE